MQLTPQHLGEVVDYFLKERRGGDQEKRRATRTQLRVKVPIYPLGENMPAGQINVILQDISYFGVGLFQATAFPVGAHFLIRLPHGRHDELTLMCIVRNCRELADSIYSIGAEFECPVAPNMVDDVQKSWSQDLQRIQASILGDAPAPVRPPARPTVAQNAKVKK